MKNWVLVLQKSDLTQLGKIRCWLGMQIAQNGQELWLRCPMRKAELDEALRRLPALYTYREDAQGLLFQAGRSTPSSRLPLLNWVPLTEYLPVELPVAALPAHLPTPHLLQLLPTAEVQDSVALKISLEQWQLYAETAPAIRMECLRFALSGAGEVLVMGEPLPPIPGQEYWLQESILLPAGYDFEWAIVAQLLQMRENSEGKYYLVFNHEGNWQKIEKQYFVPATRAGIRLSKY